MAITNNHPLIKHLLAVNAVYDLDLVKALINQLQLKPNYPIILVAGTNGKGSTCGYIANILIHAGYKVASYSSPHVLCYNERIKVNHELINDVDLTQILNLILNMEPHRLSLFSAFTLAAYIYFNQQQVDIAIIEVGIGGKFDITNLFEPLIGVITSIDYDHCDILGNSKDSIVRQKAGIFRPHKYAFIGNAQISDKFINELKQQQIKLQLFNQNFGYTKHDLSFDVRCNDKKYYSLPYPSLRGIEQLSNASLAIAVINSLQNLFPVSLNNIKHGLINNQLIGRFQSIPGLPQVILDVAHNPSAVNAMLQNMLKLPYAKNNFAVFGLASNKDLEQIIKLTKSQFRKWFIAPTNIAKSYTGKQIQTMLIKYQVNPNDIIILETISQAYIKATQEADTTSRIVCFGSFLVVAKIYEYIYGTRENAKEKN